MAAVKKSGLAASRSSSLRADVAVCSPAAATWAGISRKRGNTICMARGCPSTRSHQFQVAGPQVTFLNRGCVLICLGRLG